MGQYFLDTQYSRAIPFSACPGLFLGKLKELLMYLCKKLMVSFPDSKQIFFWFPHNLLYYNFVEYSLCYNRLTRFVLSCQLRISQFKFGKTKEESLNFSIASRLWLCFGYNQSFHNTSLSLYPWRWTFENKARMREDIGITTMKVKNDEKNVNVHSWNIVN